MMSHVGNCLKLTLITLISFNHQTPLMPLWFVTVLLRSTACLWHHLPHLVRTTERLVKHGQMMSTVLSVFSCRIMSYCKYDTVSSWEPKHAKTPSPFGVMRYQVSTLTAFKIWTGCHVILHIYTYLTSCFWSSNHAFESLGHWWSLVTCGTFLPGSTTSRQRSNDTFQSSTLFQGPCRGFRFFHALGEDLTEDLTASPEKITRKS